MHTHRICVGLLSLVMFLTSQTMILAQSIDPANIKGAESCTKCHQAEHKAWEQTVHFKNHSRITSPAGKEYAKKAGGTESCFACHSTPMTDQSKVVGVSCESCHSPAGGPNGWFDLHSNYGSPNLKRADEDATHRDKRLADCDAAGMIRASNLYALAKNCASCHIVNDEKVLLAGHKSGHADFSLVPWTDGEVRHNFQVDQKKNADMPSLLKAIAGGSEAERNRTMLVVGKLVELEVSLRTLSTIDSGNLKKAYVKSLSKRADDTLDFLKKRVLKADKDKSVAAAIKAAEDVKLGSGFKDQAGAAKAADAVAEAAKKFADAHDGSKLSKKLDSLVKREGRPKGKVYQP